MIRQRRRPTPADAALAAARDREQEELRLGATFAAADLNAAAAAHKVTQLRQLVGQAEGFGNSERLSRYRAALAEAEAEHERLREDALAANAALAEFAKGER